MRRICLCTLVALVVASCGGSDAVLSQYYPNKDVVTSIPPGDAIGTAYTGTYESQLDVKACSGVCPDINIGSATYTMCEPGQQYVEILDVSQDDGYLEVYLDLGFLETTMAGGIYRNRNFEVGSFSSSSYGDIDVSALTKGVFLPGDRINGQIKVLGSGDFGGTFIDCKILLDLSGARAE